MRNDLVIVYMVAIAVVIFGAYWFFGPHIEGLFYDDPIFTVYVKNGNFEPSQIQIPPSQATKIQFIREDSSPFAESVSFPELNMSYALPLNQPVLVTLPPLPIGEVLFMGHMGMLKGRILVKV